ncbi:extracellular matrix protein 1 isoform X1 [Pygocentrus nattereri]|uniref:Extracellular matrix protein 1b n=1 Tax=Pygocentrus nattereri TaxID=42514 RepID=A0A3B4EB41_PYGNA|nr:extracellular matrix protein 1 isoform X1 [Pygocentrus nattereri]
MGSVQRYVLLLVVFVVRAEDELFLGQREVILELDDLENGDFTELDEYKLMQKEVLPDISLIERDALRPGHSLFSPRSMGPPQIPFPLARPQPNNVQAICRYGNQRPRYPKETLPQNGYGYLVRQAKAVNQLESWFPVCCSHGTENEELLLCCTEQAWKMSLSAFCDEEFTIKTSHFHCCKKKGSHRWKCFENDAPNKSYEPSGQGLYADIPSMTMDFKFNPDNCQKTRSQMVPRAVRERMTSVLNSYFPPGCPKSGNIGSICAYRKQRRQYFSTCLPRNGYLSPANEVKAIYELEKGFNQCCKQKKGRQACAERKWKTMVDDFCMNKNVDGSQLACCEKDERKEKYDCFAYAAPNPDYILNNDSLSVLQARPTLDMFCDMYLSYHRTQRMLDHGLEMFAGKLAQQCCHLVEERNTACLHTQLDNIVDDVCDDQFMRSMICCMGNPMNRSKCVTKYILRRLANELNYKSQKKCPILS